MQQNVQQQDVPTYPGEQSMQAMGVDAGSANKNYANAFISSDQKNNLQRPANAMQNIPEQYEQQFTPLKSSARQYSNSEAQYDNFLNQLTDNEQKDYSIKPFTELDAEGQRQYKNNFYSRVDEYKKSLDKGTNQILITDMYQEAVNQNLSQQQWDQYIKRKLNLVM